MASLASLMENIEHKTKLLVEKFNSLDDSQLIEKLKALVEEAKEKDEKELEIKDAIFLSQTIYEGLAARNILQKRYGYDYVLDLMGYRNPEGLIERIKTFITKIPPYKHLDKYENQRITQIF